MNKLFIALILLAGSVANAGSADVRRVEVLRHALKLVNDQKTDLGRLIQKEREEGTTGFQNDPNDVIPMSLTAKNVRIVELSQEEYAGKMIDIGEFEAGYDNRTYLLLIPKSTVYYGGRITSTDSILLYCSSDKEENAKASTIDCQIQTLK